MLRRQRRLKSEQDTQRTAQRLLVNQLRQSSIRKKHGTPVLPAAPAFSAVSQASRRSRPVPSLAAASTVAPSAAVECDGGDSEDQNDALASALASSAEARLARSSVVAERARSSASVSAAVMAGASAIFDDEEEDDCAVLDGASADLAAASREGATQSRQSRWSRLGWNETGGAEDGSLAFVPEAEAGQVDEEVLRSLPTSMQQEYIGELRRQQQQGARARMLPAAADPRSFSREQLRSFLQGARLNLAVDRVNAEQAKRVLQGQRIVGDAGRQFLLQRADGSALETGGIDSRVALLGAVETASKLNASAADAGLQSAMQMSVSNSALAAAGSRKRSRENVGVEAFVESSGDEYEDLDSSACANARSAQLSTTVSTLHAIFDADEDAFDDGGLAKAVARVRSEATLVQATTSVDGFASQQTGAGLAPAETAAADDDDGEWEDAEDTEDEEDVWVSRSLAVEKASTVPRVAPHHVGECSVAFEDPSPNAVDNHEEAEDAEDDEAEGGGFVAEDQGEQDVEPDEFVHGGVALQAEPAKTLPPPIVAAVQQSPTALACPPETGTGMLPSELEEEESDPPAKPDATMAALEAAAATASLLTSWAGAAVRRIIKRHDPSMAPLLKQGAAIVPKLPVQTRKGEHGSREAASAPLAKEELGHLDSEPAATAGQGEGIVAALECHSPLAASSPSSSASVGFSATSSSESANPGWQPTRTEPSAADPIADAAALAALEAEEARLQATARRSQRDAESVTDSMQQEVMALLQLWGIPYIVAPMEAEAQCAELERLGLCEGVITDDSDAFLFGAKQVFKNIFESAKYVEVYKADDVERELGLSRDDLIRAALLLGSDYTEGVRGVGIVNAVEILRAFPGDEGLRELRHWIDGLDGAAEEARLVREVRKDASLLESMAPAERFKLTHQGARKRWVLGDTFPNRLVLHAYRHPNVSHNTSRFNWTAPDFEGLAAFAVQTLQFSEAQAAAVLVPVAQELSRRFVQRGMDGYLMRYQDKERAGVVRSKRLKHAVEGLAGKELADELASQRKR